MLHSATIQDNDFLEVLLPEALEHERIPPDAATRETVSINRYLGAAIQTAQNYLDKDLWPTEHSYSGIELWPFEWTRGNVRSVNAIVPEPGRATLLPSRVRRTLRSVVILPADPKGLVDPDTLVAAAEREVMLGRDPDRVSIREGVVEPDPLAIVPSTWLPPSGWIDAGVTPVVSGGTDLRAGRMLIGWPAASTFGGAIMIEGGFASAADLPNDVVQFILTTFGAFYELREIVNYSSMVFRVDIYPLWLLDPYRTLSYA